MAALILVFWGCVLGILHSYLFYPLFLRLRVTRCKEHAPLFGPADELPRISILMAAYNEENVLLEKLESIRQSDYPMDRVQVYLGSDCSTDQTERIAADFANTHPWLHVFPFTERRGKPGIINDLARQAIQDWGDGKSHVLIITDANVFFHPMTIFHLARHFRDKALAVTDSHILPLGLREEGISRAEHRYISLEAQIKHWEGRIWGAMIGPFGGCYAIRSDYFSPVPANFLVDDFYIVLRALEKGGRAINDLEAICFEGATHAMQTEFRRKRRIGAGNFQNMRVFRHLWLPPWRSGMHFAFFSHKILRWLTPHGMVLSMAALAILAALGNHFYFLLFTLAATGAIGIFVFDLILKQLGIQILPLRGIRYFIWMNAALFMGWIDYLKGIKSNVWQPTQRNE